MQSNTCPKMVKLRSLNPDGSYREIKEVCGNDLSPGYAHCSDHITDTEFFKKHPRREVKKVEKADELKPLALQIVGTTKALLKGKDVEMQLYGLRVKWGNMVADLPDLEERQRAQRMIQHMREMLYARVNGAEMSCPRCGSINLMLNLQENQAPIKCRDCGWTGWGEPEED